MEESTRQPKRPLILVIEDDEAQSALIRKKLQLASFDVIICKDVATGLRLSEENNFAVAVVDLDLGGESGLEFVRGNSRIRSKTKVILHSVDASFQTVKEGLNLGVFAYIEKGRTDNQLIDYCHRAASAYLSETLLAANEAIAFQLRLLEAVDHGIIATDNDGTIIYWNRFSERLTGLEQSSTTGKLFFDYVSSGEPTHTIRKAIEVGENWSGECLLKQNGLPPNAILVRMAISPLLDSGGMLIGSVISHHDLTMVKANEQRLEDRARLMKINAELGRLAIQLLDPSKLLQQVLNKLDEGLFLHSGRVQMFNPASAKLETLVSFGSKSRSEWEKATLREVDQLRLQELIKGFRMPFFENGELVACIEGEFESSRTVGVEKKDFLQSVSSLVSGVFRHNWATHLWKSLFENSLDAVLIANHEGRFVDGNTEACDLLGYSRNEFLQLSVRNLIVPDRAAPFESSLHKLITIGKLSGEIELFCKDKTVIIAEFLAVANILSGIHVAHFRDITNKKRSEKLISEQQDQLTHVQRTSTMGQMAAVLAHEINQPLGAISNFAGGLLYGLKKEKSADIELAETLGLILNESLKAGAIVNRLRKFITRDPITTKSIDLNNSVRDTIKLLANIISNQSIAIDLELDQLLPLVQADSIRIQQVLLNVIKNSLEAISENELSNRVVRIASSSFDDCVKITIQDNGPEISDVEFRNLFKPYHTSKTNGLGMGLCISQTIIEQHQGTIVMSPIVPNGMLTTICIPVGFR